MSIIYQIVLGLLLCKDHLADDSPCSGDTWLAYKDDKCIMIQNSLMTEEDAVKACISNDSTLLAIHSQDEQDYLENYLFNTSKVVDNVWLGAKYINDKLSWLDNSDTTYTNWGEGCPRNGTGIECIQISSDVESRGKWQNEPCSKKNLFVCQRMQSWSLSRLQKTLLDTRKGLNDKVEELVHKNEELNKKNDDLYKKNEELTHNLDALVANPVPIGFIYIQLPTEAEPKTIWPNIEWKDITQEYAGLFFRAEGGGSEKFGDVQECDAPRLVQTQWVEYTLKFQDFAHTPRATQTIIPGQWSDMVFPGIFSSDKMADSNRLLVSNVEVRPRNKAIRIFKRIK